MPYPTREEILARPHLHKPEVIREVKDWKRFHWYPVRNAADGTKIEAIRMLVNHIANIYEVPPVEVIWTPTGAACYVAGTIYLDKPSIITALHELAHHLFGSSEFKACRWSLWLFKKTFPRAYETLHWRRHMMVRPSPLTVQEAADRVREHVEDVLQNHPERMHNPARVPRELEIRSSEVREMLQRETEILEGGDDGETT